MKVYTPGHSIIHETSIDISNRVNISRPINLVQYDSLPIIKVNLFYGSEPYTIPEGIDLVRLRMGRLPSQYYYKDILGWSPDKQSVYIQVEEDMTKDIGEFGLVIEFIKFDYVSSKNKAGPDLKGKEYLGDGWYGLYNLREITLDYNIYNGMNSMVGTPTSNAFNMVKYQLNGEQTYTLSAYKISGTTNNFLYSWFFGTNITIMFPTTTQQTKTLPTYDTQIYAVPGSQGNQYDIQFKLQIEEGIEATDFEPPIKLMVAASSKVNVIVERNPVEGFSRNFGMPILKDKEYLGDGWYQIYNNSGVVVNYNIIDNHYHKYGKSTADIYMPIADISGVNIGTINTMQVWRVSGTGSVYPFIQSGSNFGVNLVSNMNYNKITKILNEANPKTIQLFNVIGHEDNIIFKIQIEEGPVATPWTPPNKQETEVK